MLLNKVIKTYLESPRPDFRPWKTLTEPRMERAVAKLPVVPPIWKRLRRMQKVCLLLGIRTRRFCFFADTGTGKTLLSLALIQYFRRLGEVHCTLVLVPNKVNKDEWSDEIQKHCRKIPYVILKGSSKQKWEQLTRKSVPIVIETYAGLVHMLTKKNPDKKKTGLVVSPDSMAQMLGLIDGLIMDESTEVKSSASKQFKICRTISRNCSMVFGLTGTPFGRDPIDLWAQFAAVDLGRTLGRNKKLFLGAFFKPYYNGFASKYKFLRSMNPQLNRMLAAGSIRFAKDQADLPALARIQKRTGLGDEAQAYYNRSKQAIIEAKGDWHESRNAFLRLRQISSGFLGFTNDDTGEKAKLIFDENPKLDLLESLVQSIAGEHKFIVFHDFIFSGGAIHDRLKHLGIKTVRLWGGSKDTKAVLDRFKRDKACRGLILNNDAGAFGLNLQVASYGFYYESPVSGITRRQTEARFVRQFSEHETVFMYDLIAAQVDKTILEYHAEGKDLFTAIIDGKARL